MDTLFATDLQKDNKMIKYFSKELLNQLQAELRTSNIDPSNYSKMVDLITCLNVKVDEMNFNLGSYVTSRTTKRHRHNIDFKV